MLDHEVLDEPALADARWTDERDDPRLFFGLDRLERLVERGQLGVAAPSIHGARASRTRPHVTTFFRRPTAPPLLPRPQYTTWATAAEPVARKLTKGSTSAKLQRVSGEAEGWSYDPGRARAPHRVRVQRRRAPEVRRSSFGVSAQVRWDRGHAERQGRDAVRQFEKS